MKTIIVSATSKTYSVHIETGILAKLNSFLDPDKQYVLISDDGIPKQYVKSVTSQLPDTLEISFPQGEKSKSLHEYEHIIDIMIDNSIPKDAVLIALGGGVTGDLAGYVAATYMRGISYIQIPTTLLAQIDSSVGGKVAINTAKAKNVIGSIYPPDLVLIDPAVLKTLDLRQLNNGMSEMIKYGMIADGILFEKIRTETVFDDIESFIFRSLEIKRKYVEADEFDNNLRQVLNFGHTYGHAIEAYYDFKKYLHGEAVAIGMVRITKDETIKAALVEVLNKFQLPIADPVTDDLLKSFLTKDKKNRGQNQYHVEVPKIGTSVIKPFSF